jgi:hypothetical protein
MATRRAKMTTNNSYTQPLKLGLGRKVILSHACDYHSVLLSKRYKPRQDFEHILWAKFNTGDLEGLYLVAYLNGFSSDECEFNVYEVSLDGLWDETPVASETATLSNDKFVAEFLGEKFDGSKTYAIESKITRLGKEYKKKIYVNHLGIYDSFIRLRNYVEFIDATKGDE